MEGDGRARFCATCQTHVHSIADYSPKEWNQLWRDSNGHVCGFLSGASPTPPRSRRAILFGALLSVVSPLFAASGRVRFRVKDPTGALVDGASVSLIGKDNQAIRTLRTEKNGELVWTDLLLGNSVFQCRAFGFESRPITITIRSPKELKVEVYLRMPTVGQTVILDDKPEKHHGWLIYY